MWSDTLPGGGRRMGGVFGVVIRGRVQLVADAAWCRTSYARRLRRLAVTGLLATPGAVLATTLAAALAQASGVEFEYPDGGETTVVRVHRGERLLLARRCRRASSFGALAPPSDSRGRHCCCRDLVGHPRFCDASTATISARKCDQGDYLNGRSARMP